MMIFSHDTILIVFCLLTFLVSYRSRANTPLLFLFSCVVVISQPVVLYYFTSEYICISDTLVTLLLLLNLWFLNRSNKTPNMFDNLFLLNLALNIPLMSFYLVWLCYDVSMGVPLILSQDSPVYWTLQCFSFAFPEFEIAQCVPPVVNDSVEVLERTSAAAKQAAEAA